MKYVHIALLLVIAHCCLGIPQDSDTHTDPAQQGTAAQESSDQAQSKTNEQAPAATPVLTSLGPECNVRESPPDTKNASEGRAFSRLVVTCNKYNKFQVGLFSLRIGPSLISVPLATAQPAENSGFTLDVPVQSDTKRLILLSKGQCDESLALDPNTPCEPLALLLYTGTKQIRQEEKPESDKWIVALVKQQSGYKVQRELFKQTNVVLVVNGRILTEELGHYMWKPMASRRGVGRSIPTNSRIRLISRFLLGPLSTWTTASQLEVQRYLIHLP
jgi:hypothetical protein